MAVTITPTAATYHVGDVVTVTVDGLTPSEVADLYLVGDGVNGDSDVLAETTAGGAGDATFAGVIIPAYNVGDPGTTAFKVVDASNLEEQYSDNFTILAAVAAVVSRVTSLGVGYFGLPFFH